MSKTVSYSIVNNQIGYLPDTEPWTVTIELEDIDIEAAQVLRLIRDEVERYATDDCQDDDDVTRWQAWQTVLKSIDADLKRALEIDPRKGFLYNLPDGTVMDVAYEETP